MKILFILWFASCLGMVLGEKIHYEPMQYLGMFSFAIFFFCWLLGVIFFSKPEKKQHKSAGRISRVHAAGSAQSVIIENDDYVGVLTKVKKNPAQNKIGNDTSSSDDTEERTYSSAEMWEEAQEQEELENWHR